MAIRRQVNRGGRVSPGSIPAPFGGWNTRDSLDAMPPTDAVKLINWIPDVGKVSVRRGNAAHVTLGGTNVDTLAEYNAKGVRHLIAAANTKLFNASSVATEIGTGFLSDQWQTANFSGRMFLVNGLDDPQDWDGTTLSATAWSGAGLTPSDLVGVNVFKNRLFFWETDSQDFWYAPLDAITGGLTKFTLSRAANLGGDLVAIATWTVDSGSGYDDRAVFIMSSGQLVVYAGTDPGDATAWKLEGVYQTGEPMGVRAIVQVGGDVMITTKDDYVSLSAVVANGQIGTSSKLSGAVRDATAAASDIFGWQSVLFRPDGLIINNVPRTDGTLEQYVINTTTGGPCRFVGLNGRSWSIFNNELYFGGTDGKIYKYTGNQDGTADIETDAEQAWNSVGSFNRKRVAACRPILSTNGLIDYSFSIGFDFQPAFISNPQSSSVSVGLWDISFWDVTPWSDESIVDKSWRVCSGNGQNISPRLKVNSRQAVSWLRTDLRLEVGRNL